MEERARAGDDPRRWWPTIRTAASRSGDAGELAAPSAFARSLAPRVAAGLSSALHRRNGTDFDERVTFDVQARIHARGTVSRAITRG